MKLNDINKLIEKYENAETSLKEENILKEYFQRDIVPVHLLMYKDIFNYYSESKSETVTKPNLVKSRSINLKWLSIAASFMLLVSFYTFKTIDNNNQANMAYVETQKAFQLIGTSLNNGTTLTVNGLNEFEKTKNKVFNNK